MTFFRCALVISLLLCMVGNGRTEEKTSGQTTAPKPTAEQKALALKIDDIVKAAQGTPGQEAANYLSSGQLAYFRAMLKGNIKAASQKQLESAAARVKRFADRAAKGPDWPRPPHIKITHAVKAPQIDGKLDDPAWKEAVTFTGLYLFDEKEQLQKPATTWKILWDKDNLYFAFECEDSDIVSPEVPRDNHVYFNDCVEMFIQPSPRTGMYWEIVISPTGMIFDALQNKKPRERGKIARENENVVGMKIGRILRGTPNNSSDTDEGYTIEVAVPFRELPEYALASPAAGQTMTLMLVRLDRTGDPKGTDFKTYAFIPLLSWGHNVWNHATAELVE